MTDSLRDNLDRTHRLRLVHVRPAGNWSVATRRHRGVAWREWLVLAILGLALLLLFGSGLVFVVWVLLAIGRALSTGGV